MSEKLKLVMFSHRVRFYQFILISLLFASQSSAQNTVLEMPEKYWAPNDTITKPYLSEFFPCVELENRWIVFSDRSNNIAYADDDGDKVIDTLGFMEAFVVLQIESNRLKVGRINSLISDKYILQENTFWVDINNLQLSPFCLVEDCYKINRKGLVLNSLDSSGVIFHDSALFYKSAFFINDVLDSKKINYQQFWIFKYSSDSNFVFVGNDCLISNDQRNDFDEIQNKPKKLFGWINRKCLIPWNHRVVWEINWDESAASERKNKFAYELFPGALAFTSKSDALRFGESGYTLSTLPDHAFLLEPDSFYMHRRKGFENHFPLLPNNCDSINFDFKTINNNYFYPKRIGIIKVNSSINNEILFNFNTAYSGMSPKIYTFPLFRNVVLVHNQELVELYFQLLKLKNSNNLRKDVRICLAMITQSIVGDYKESFNNEILSQFIQSLTQLQLDDHFSLLKINDIENPAIIQNRDIVLLKFGLMDVYKRISSIIDSWEKYEGADYLNNELHFWIPLEYMLPL